MRTARRHAGWPSTTSRPLRRSIATAAIVLALGTVAIGPAAADHGGGVERGGHCSKSTEWKLEAKSDDGRIEVEAEIDSDVNGQKWTWKLLHNGDTSAHGTAKTKPPSGSFEVERTMVNAPGADRIGLRASNSATGETCSGSLTY